MVEAPINGSLQKDKEPIQLCLGVATNIMDKINTAVSSIITLDDDVRHGLYAALILT